MQGMSVWKAHAKSSTDPPSIGDGPYVAAGNWPLLSASEQSPTYLKRNRSVLWTFSDDFASCSGLHAHGRVQRSGQQQLDIR